MNDPERRLRQRLREHRRRKMMAETAVILDAMVDRGLISHDEAKKHRTPTPIARCVASVINKGGGSRSMTDVSDEEKSRAFAVCWASKNKGQLGKKGFGGKQGKARKKQYKALFKKPRR